jgi:hypothetical protein
VLVNPVNDLPIASDDTITTSEDTSITLSTDLLSNDNDVDTEDILSISGVNNPVNGTATLNEDGNIVFTPAANFYGTASLPMELIVIQHQ